MLTDIFVHNSDSRVFCLLWVAGADESALDVHVIGAGDRNRNENKSQYQKIHRSC